MMPLIPVSCGDLLDKITILEIKAERLDADAAANARRELVMLDGIALAIGFGADVMELKMALRLVNAALWDIETRIRAFEGRRDFGQGFIAAARAIYQNNDLRARIKREINMLAKSDLVEEKDYSA